MCWCPFFHEKVLNESSENSEILGYLAVTSDVGKILIFKINKEIDLPSDNPPVVISTPLFIFEHPTVPVGKPQRVDFEDLFQSVIEDNDNTLPSTSEFETSGIAESIASTSSSKKRNTRKRALMKVVEEPTESEIADEEDVEMENDENAKKQKKLKI
uniref:Uncharacterized protein n=1 Tax=Panagrolaimus sp. ES5 TaxID=591445 RepID=A0AC34GJ15_9BILA